VHRDSVSDDRTKAVASGGFYVARIPSEFGGWVDACLVVEHCLGIFEKCNDVPFLLKGMVTNIQLSREVSRGDSLQQRI
jgi:hypothetical protein